MGVVRNSSRGRWNLRRVKVVRVGFRKDCGCKGWRLLGTCDLKNRVVRGQGSDTLGFVRDRG